MSIYRPSSSDPNSHLVASFIGQTVEVFMRDERVMSDVYAPVSYAICYDAKKDTFEDVYVRAHFECGDHRSYAEVDATDDVIARYQAWKAEERAKEDERLAKARVARRIAEEKRPAKGKTVKVVRGRKIPIGTVGLCTWYGRGNYGDRVGIKVQGSSEILWTDAKNVEAVVNVKEIEAEEAA